MLTTLVASGRRPAGSANGAVASVLAHGAIIAAALLGTRDIVRSPRDVPDVHPVRYVAPARPAPQPAPSRPARPPIAVTPATPDTRSISQIPVITIGIQPPVVTVPVVRAGDASLRASFSDPVATVGSGTGGSGDGDSTALTGDQVERSAEVVRAVSPRYPELLRSAGITGVVLARFVVGTDGRVEAETIELVESAHEAFGDAVKRALLATRFRPAELGGRAVRQLVEQRFTFRVNQ